MKNGRKTPFLGIQRYRTVRLIVVLRVCVPEVPVTVSEYVPAGVPPGAGGVGVGPGTAPPPPPPQPSARTRMARQKSFRSCGIAARPLATRRIRSKPPRMAYDQSQEPGCVDGGMAAVRAVEVTDTWADTLPPFGFTDPGDTPHVAPVGAPEQLRVTVWLNPFDAAMLSPIVAPCPALIDTEDPDGSVSEKSAGGGGGVMPSDACR